MLSEFLYYLMILWNIISLISIFVVLFLILFPLSLHNIGVFLVLKKEIFLYFPAHYNCLLCTMQLDGYCPGCGGGAGNQGCAIARCSMERGHYQYCFECNSYPCDKYNGITEYDSFITHRNQLSDMKKAELKGLVSYHAELEEKAVFYKYLLKNYNDGRRKTFFFLFSILHVRA